MAVIVCVFSYKEDENGKAVTNQEVHVMELDKNDKLLWVTTDPDLALQLEEPFPPLYLKTGDLAPVALVNETPSKEINGQQVPTFNVFYHGFQAKFKCGDRTPEGFEPKVHGVPSPSGQP